MSFKVVYEKDEVWVTVSGIHLATDTMDKKARSDYIAALANLPKGVTLDDEIRGNGEIDDSDIYIFRCYEGNILSNHSYKTPDERLSLAENKTSKDNLYKAVNLYNQVRATFRASSGSMLQSRIDDLVGCVLECSTEDDTVHMVVNIIPVDKKYIALEFEIKVTDLFDGEDWDEFLKSALENLVNDNHPFVKKIEEDTDCFVEFQLYQKKTQAHFKDSLVLSSAIEADGAKKLYPVFNEWLKEIGMPLLDYIDSKLLAR